MESLPNSVIAYPIDAVPAIAGVTRTQVFEAINGPQARAANDH